MKKQHKTKIKLFLFLVIFFIFMNVQNVKALTIYDKVYPEEDWKVYEYSNLWGSTSFTSPDEYKLKAWNYLIFGNGEAKFAIETIEGYNDKLEVPTTGEYRLRTRWEFSGEMYSDFENYFRFTYELYYMSGENEYNIDLEDKGDGEGVKKYTARHTFDEEIQRHTFGTASLDSTKDYYVKIHIKLYSDEGSTLDFKDGSNKIKLLWIGIINA